MKLRPYFESDIPGLVSLLNEVDVGTYEFIPWTEQDLQAELEGAGSIMLAVDGQDRIAGLAYLREEWWSETVALRAQPGREQENTWELLLTVIERGTQTGRLTILIDTLDQGLLSFLGARGYATDSTSYHMITTLNEPHPLPPVPEGYLIRSLRPDEEEQLIRLANDAYHLERLRPGILARWTAEDSVFSMHCVKVAEYEGELVAAVVARSDREYNKHYHANRGYLGPAATLPSHRGKGLSKALTARAMNVLHELGMQTVCLHTWQTNRPALEVTGDLGFRPEHEWKVLRKTLQ